MGGFGIVNFNILGGFQKTKDFLGGYEDVVDIFCGHYKVGLYLEVISMHFRVFSEGQGTEWRIFGVAKISNIYLGCLIFLIFLGGERKMLGPSLHMKKK